MHLYITLSLPSDALQTSNVKGVMPQQNMPSQAWFTSMDYFFLPFRSRGIDEVF